jgi:hypothetical protein
MRQGAQSVFFSELWGRIHSDFDGVDKSSMNQVVEKVNLIVDQSARKSSKATASPSKSFSNDDFEIALHLLQLPCTPNCTESFKGAPNVDITPAPV